MSKSANYYADTIINAISTIAQNKVQNAAFDKTVIAKVKKCADKATGKYIINYKDIDQEAYAANVNMKYEKDQLVYVLFPGNNSQRVKTIINTVDHNATTSDDIKSTDQLYNETGPNIITLSDLEKNNILIENNTIQLYSYRPLPLGKEGYLYLKGGENNVINIDESLYRYLQQGNSIILTAGLRTNIDQSRQAYGQYGIKIVCNFKDNGSENNIIQKEYTLSNFDVIGYPYTVIVKTDIKHLEDFDSQNFIDIESIQAYCYNFLNTENEPKDQRPDIFLYDFAVQGVDRLTESQLNGYHVNINYSTNGDTINDSVTEIILKGELKIKGNPITEDVEYYWFRQNGTVFKGTNLYSSYGGDGWECLNDKNSQSHSYYPLTSNQIRFVDSETEQAKYNDIFPTRVLNQKRLKVKCVAVYKTVRESGQGVIYNSNVSNDIKIQSSDRKGEENQVNYYFNNGSPTLTCRAFTNQGKELDSQDYPDLKGKYFWSINYGSGNIQQITTKEEVLTDYYNKQEEYKKFLKEYEKVQEAKKEEYWNLKEDIRNNWEAVKNQQIVDGKKLINLDISKIKKSATITCGVQQLNGQDSFYLGTSSITIYNSFEVKDGYSLNVENGIQVYQYNNDGISPASGSIEKPIKIKPLSFALIDPEGHIIPYEQILANGFVRWCIPKTNTLLVNSIDNGDALDDIGLTGTDRALAANNTYIIYANKDSISYSIADIFDYNAKNNNIRLYIAYKDMVFDEWTNFTFPKSGDPGTNGTKYYAKIYPIINKDGEEKKIISDSVYIDSLGNHYDNQGRKWDKVIPILYNGSTEVNYNESTKLLWSCPIESAFSNNSNKLDRKYQSHFSFDSNNKVLNLKQPTLETRLDILRAQIGSGEDLKFFAELPVCYVHTIEENGNAKYRIKLKEKTGYNYVVYAEDGTNPIYENSNNFELILEKLINGYYIEQDFDSNKYTYTWSVQGNLELKNENENTNIGIIQPKEKFNGEISKNIVICKIEIIEEESEDKSVIIHIPVYMLINRYGHSALNDWDGNSIDLGKDSGTILAPQVGAGKKSAEDNTFTGVLMGQIKYQPKEEEEEKPNEVGLFGYNRGQRTIFLDAQTGKAEFGKNGSGKIIIDPSLTINDKEVALLYSNNFNVLGDTSDGDAKNGYIKEQGLLERNGQYINYQIEQGQGGMLIDLTTPQIAFANGKFNVNKQGKLHSESGDIGGWQITKNTLQSTYGNGGGVYLNSDGSATTNMAIKVNNGNKNIFYTNYKGYMHSEFGDIGGWNITSTSLYHGEVGMQAKEGDSQKAFYAGAETNPDTHDRPFYVRNDGFFKSTSGRIASWNINDNALYNASVGLGTREVTSDNPFTSSAIQARFWAGSPSTADTDLNFIVSNTGRIYSKAGLIGGWTIDNDALYSGEKSTGAGAGIRLFSNGSLSGGDGIHSWTINKNGNAAFNDINASGGVIGNWTIKNGAITNNNSTATLVELKSNGEFYANKGSIGGIEIYNGGIRDEAGGKWYITPNTAYFTGLRIDTTANDGAGSASFGGTGGSGISGNGYDWGPTGSMDSDEVKVDGKTLKVWTGDMVNASTGQFGTLIADVSFTYSGHDVKWSDISVVTDVTPIKDPTSGNVVAVNIQKTTYHMLTAEINSF